MRIGKYEINGGILAPMAGYTDIAFRELCIEHGAALTVTEMVSVRGIVHGNAATNVLMRLGEKERPSCVQLFGNDPDDFARAAEKTECDIIDINMGCPMPKIVKNGDGAALMNDPENAGNIVRALKKATDRPITVKTRLGYRMDEVTAAELIESVANAGAAAVAVHGRFAEQRYAGSSDIECIRKLAERAPLPIIVNGDMTDINAAQPFAAVMIGRAALKDPSVFDGKPSNPFAVARRHVELLKKYFDERYVVFQARKFFVHYFSGVRCGKQIRAAVNDAQSSSEILKALDFYERSRL